MYFFRGHTVALNVDLKPNQNNIKTDFIIVGQGLAGSILAVMLIDKGFKVTVIDQPSLSLCSKIGGGGINPVVFKRLTKSWMSDEILPVLHTFFSDCEKKFNCKLIVPRNIVKLFTEQQEADLWLKKSESEMKEYLAPKIYHEPDFSGIKISETGYSLVKRAAGFIMQEFLSGAKKYIIENGDLIEEQFNYNELTVNEGVKYKNIHADKIIFAEGYLVKNNPWFNFIPMKPVKGEILTITSDGLNLGNNIIKKNAFLTHIYANVYKTGSTYNWDSINDEITVEGKLEIERKLRKITNADYTIINQEAGVRPSGTDRRPILGKHPKCSNVFIFNGLGAKGVMLGPFFAQHLLEHLIYGNTLMVEVDVARFNKFFVN